MSEVAVFDFVLMEDVNDLPTDEAAEYGGKVEEDQKLASVSNLPAGLKGGP